VVVFLGGGGKTEILVQAT